MVNDFIFYEQIVRTTQNHDVETRAAVSRGQKRTGRQVSDDRRAGGGHGYHDGEGGQGDT